MVAQAPRIGELAEADDPIVRSNDLQEWPIGRGASENGYREAGLTAVGHEIAGQFMTTLLDVYQHGIPPWTPDSRSLTTS